MIQLTHESFFVPLQTIIKANAVKATDALDANWVADSLCTNALIKLRVVDADDVLFTSTSYYW